MIPEKWTIKFHNFLHILKVHDNQGQNEHEFDYKTPGMIPEKWTIKFHNFLHILKVHDNQGQNEHEFDYKTPLYIL
jgi:hypothetical protein